MGIALKSCCWTLALLACSALVGCGSSASSLCDAICDCQGCSDNEYDDCIDDIEDTERAAEREDCLAEFDDVLACSEEELECRGDDVEIDGCGPENKDLNDCID
jgi:hypothetical protein